jgi:hypothetical protein
MAHTHAAEYQHAITAAIDLNDNAQYIAISLSGGIPVNGADVAGILQNKPKAGEEATVLVCGYSKFRSSIGLTSNNRLTVTDSGWFTLAHSGAHVIGKSISAVTSGSIGSGIFNCINPPYAQSSKQIEG